MVALPALKTSVLHLLLLLSQRPNLTNSFVVPQFVSTHRHGVPRVLDLAASASSSSTAESSVVPTSSDVVPTSRYVVQNRFRVRKGREAAFEKRWADRESRLGTLKGFRFFCMLRLLPREEKSGDDVDENNYVSCTVWETFDDFTAWRKGDAFKEAHGGGTVKGVLSMLAATARNNIGKPKPAFWSGLLPESVPGRPPTDGEGWKRVDADGENVLPTDCFVAMNRFSVKQGMEAAFEKRFADRESTLNGQDGFRGFLLLRRDGGGKEKEPDDGYTHSTFSVWDSKENFDAWMSESKSKKPNTTTTTSKDDGEAVASKPKGPPSIYDRPPVPSFYEGILALESAPGV